MPRRSATTLATLPSDTGEISEDFLPEAADELSHVQAPMSAPQLDLQQPTVRRRRRNVQELTVPDMEPALEPAPAHKPEPVVPKAYSTSVSAELSAVDGPSLKAFSDEDIHAFGKIVLEAHAAGIPIADYIGGLLQVAHAWQALRASRAPIG